MHISGQSRILLFFHTLHRKGNGPEPAGFIYPEHYVHILDSLAGGAFDQIVNRRHQNQPVAPFIQPETNVAKIRAAYSSSIRQRALRQDADEGLFFVKIFKQYFYIFNL